MTRLAESRVLSHLDLVRIISLQIVRRLPANFDVADLESSGLLGLVGAAAAYKNGEVPFSVFAGGEIRRAIVQYVRGEYQWEARRVPLRFTDPYQDFGVSDDVLAAALERLTARQRDLIRLVYWEGRSVRNVSRSRGCEVLPRNVVNIRTGRGIGFGGSRGGWRSVEKEHAQALAELRAWLRPDTVRKAA